MVGDILQPTHLLFILVVALLVLGPKRLPEVGRTLGSGLRDFRQAINGDSSHNAYDWSHQMADATEQDPQAQRAQPSVEPETATIDAAPAADTVSATAVPTVERSVTRPAAQAASVTAAPQPAASARPTTVAQTRAASRPARAERPAPASPAPSVAKRRPVSAAPAPTPAAQPSRSASPVDRPVQRIPRPGEAVSRPRRTTPPRTSPGPRDS